MPQPQEKQEKKQEKKQATSQASNQGKTRANIRTSTRQNTKELKSIYDMDKSYQAWIYRKTDGSRPAYLGILQAPITEDDLIKHFGGGTYDIRPRKNDSFHGSIIVEIDPGMHPIKTLGDLAAPNQTDNSGSIINSNFKMQEYIDRRLKENNENIMKELTSHLNGLEERISGYVHAETQPQKLGELIQIVERINGITGNNNNNTKQVDPHEEYKRMKELEEAAEEKGFETAKALFESRIANLENQLGQLSQNSGNNNNSLMNMLPSLMQIFQMFQGNNNQQPAQNNMYQQPPASNLNGNQYYPNYQNYPNYSQPANGNVNGTFKTSAIFSGGNNNHNDQGDLNE